MRKQNMLKDSLRLFRKLIALSVLLCTFCCVMSAQADTLVVLRDGKEVSLQGELLQEAQDKSILFQTTDGQLHIFEAGRIVTREPQIEIAPAMTHEEVGEALLAELPDRFKILQTEHYVIAYQTELAYAKWIGDLYEDRLFPEFKKFAKKKLKYKLKDSKFPLVAVVFGSKPAYEAYAQRELGEGIGSMIAHYNQMTNRVAMYDLTFDLGGGVPGDPRRLDKVLASPTAIPMVATIIHEGTHQLMYNRGMQTRFADGPLWLNEGMANWFETPDLRNGKGWRRPGLVSPLRLGQLKKYLPNRPQNSLESLISSDVRFAGEGAFDAYAESWALNHFLLKRRTREFRGYLKAVSDKQQGGEVDAATRLKEFKEHFGDLQKLDRAFQKYIETLR